MVSYVLMVQERLEKLSNIVRENLENAEAMVRPQRPPS